MSDELMAPSEQRGKPLDELYGTSYRREPNSMTYWIRSKRRAATRFSPWRGCLYVMVKS